MVVAPNKCQCLACLKQEEVEALTEAIEKLIAEPHDLSGFKFESYCGQPIENVKRDIEQIADPVRLFLFNKFSKTF
jgi:hypothetical protein